MQSDEARSGAETDKVCIFGCAGKDLLFGMGAVMELCDFMTEQVSAQMLCGRAGV